MVSQFSPTTDSDMNLRLHVNVEKSSSTAAYEYFSAKLSETRSSNVSESVELKS